MRSRPRRIRAFRFSKSIPGMDFSRLYDYDGFEKAGGKVPLLIGHARVSTTRVAHLGQADAVSYLRGRDVLVIWKLASLARSGGCWPNGRVSGWLRRGGAGSVAAIGEWLRARGGSAMNNEMTSILSAIEQGDPRAAEQLLPLVYHELRMLAARKLAQEKPGQTLQATALVHEAYFRLVGGGAASLGWNSRGHFFAAAAEAMRRILVEKARRKRAVKHAGGRVRVSLEGLDLVERVPSRAVARPG